MNSHIRGPLHTVLFHFFLCTFLELRKAIVNFMSVCPSVRIEQLGSRWMDFHAI